MLCSVNYSVLRTIILADVAMNSLLLVASVLLVQNDLNSNNDGTISFRCFFGLSWFEFEALGLL